MIIAGSPGPEDIVIPPIVDRIERQIEVLLDNVLLMTNEDYRILLEEMKKIDDAPSTE